MKLIFRVNNEIDFMFISVSTKREEQLCCYARKNVINIRTLQHLKHSNHFSASINQ